MKHSGNAHLSEIGEAMPEIAYGGGTLHESGPRLDNTQNTYLVPNWFAVFTSPRHEKRVEQYLRLRDIEHYLPVYRTPRKWRNGVKVLLDIPLFPGYVFVRIKRTERVRVLEVPGVLAIVGGTGGQMAPLPEAEVEVLRSGLQFRQAEPHPLLAVGQRARIRSGALAGLEGIVVRKKNSLRFVLTMDLIMQSIAVEVDGEELEPINSEPLNRSGWSNS
jgi:transcription antitermination factor NusG